MISKLIQFFFSNSISNPKYKKLRIKNEEFLSTLSYDEKIKLFEYVEHYASITYSDKQFQHPELSSFFNHFFSKYEMINMGETYVINSNNLKEKDSLYLDCILNIGHDMEDCIYIKKNDPLNNIYIETLDLEESILNNNPLYSSFYQYLLETIAHVYDLDLANEYKNLLGLKRDI